MPEIIARGYLRYRLAGTYAASIVLQFDSPIHAQDALASLNGGWIQGSHNSNCLAWYGVGSALTACERVLTSYGSVPDDDGMFDISIPVFNKSEPSINFIT
jgi:hypothetical protein